MVNSKEKVKRKRKTKRAPLRDSEAHKRRYSQARVPSLKQTEMTKASDHHTSIPECPSPFIVRSQTADCGIEHVLKPSCENAFGDCLTIKLRITVPFGHKVGGDLYQRVTL